MIFQPDTHIFAGVNMDSRLVRLKEFKLGRYDGSAEKNNKANTISKTRIIEG